MGIRTSSDLMPPRVKNNGSDATACCHVRPFSATSFSVRTKSPPGVIEREARIVELGDNRRGAGRLLEGGFSQLLELS